MNITPKFIMLFIIYSIFVLMLGMVIGYCFGWYEFVYCTEDEDEFEVEEEDDTDD